MPNRQNRAWHTRTVVLVGIAACLALVLIGVRWPKLMEIPGVAAYLNVNTSPDAPVHYPFLELLKLMVSALLGIVVTAVHRHTPPGKRQSSSLEHAQVLLCISGAIIMIIIGNSLARAFGIAGGASIVRFRTPVDDPKDAMVLFLLLGIGMACGIAAFGLAILSAVFLCVILLVLSRMVETTTREMTIEMVSAGRDFPTDHVQNVFSQRAISYEQREVARGEDTTMRYLVLLEPSTTLEELSNDLMEGSRHAIKSVSWVKPKKSAQ
jgi:uncharacterized membrane protein YhiD involved in acid resistance